MPKLPRLAARQIVAVLEKVGFSLARQSGSHMIYKNSAGKRVTVRRSIPRKSFTRKCSRTYCATPTLVLKN
jgi:predicted RNA binding protein YcfA (HicA-like mRNA interferase family)